MGAQTERRGLAGPVRTLLRARASLASMGSLITRRLQSERAVHGKGPCSAERVRECPAPADGCELARAGRDGPRARRGKMLSALFPLTNRADTILTFHCSLARPCNDPVCAELGHVQSMRRVVRGDD